MTGTNPLTIDTPGATSIALRFIAFGRLRGLAAGDNAGVDAVNIAFFNAVVSQIQRTANLTGATTASLSFNYTSANLVAGDTVVVEARSTPVDSPSWGPTTAGHRRRVQRTSPPQLPPTGRSITLQFRATGTWSANGDHAEIDNVQIAYDAAPASNATATRRVRVPLAGLQLQLRHLVAGDTVNPDSAQGQPDGGDDRRAELQLHLEQPGGGRHDACLEASSSGAVGTFTTLAIIDGGGTATVSYSLTSYISANTTIRFRVSSGFAAAGKTFSVDNVEIMYASYAVPGTQIQRTAPIAGVPAPLLNFTMTSAGLVAGDTLVLEASSSGAVGTFTTLATFAGGTPASSRPTT